MGKKSSIFLLSILLCQLFATAVPVQAFAESGISVEDSDGNSVDSLKLNENGSATIYLSDSYSESLVISSKDSFTLDVVEADDAERLESQEDGSYVINLQNTEDDQTVDSSSQSVGFTLPTIKRVGLRISNINKNTEIEIKSIDGSRKRMLLVEYAKSKEKGDSVDDSLLNKKESSVVKSKKSGNSRAVSDDVLDFSASINNADIIDGTPDFDSNDEAGYDSAKNNGIVRSFDTITYPLKITLNSKTGDTLNKIKIKISGELTNGITKGRVNASFSANGTEDLETGKVTMEEEYVLENSGNAVSFPITVNVGGAYNDVNLGLKVKAQVISVDGEDYSSKNIIEEITDVKTIKTSSKVSIAPRSYVNILNNPSVFSAEHMFNKSELANYHTNVYNVEIYATPLPGKTNIKGSSFPSGKINYHIETGRRVQWIKDDDSVDYEESIPYTDATKTYFLDAQRIGSNDPVDASETLAGGYANNNNLGWQILYRNVVNIARSTIFDADAGSNADVNLGSVYDSGKLSYVSETQPEGKFNFAVDDYVISNHFPKYRSDNWKGWVSYDSNKKSFTTWQNVFLVKNDYEIGSDKNPENLANNLLVDYKIVIDSYEDEDGNTVAVNKSHKATVTFRNNPKDGFIVNTAIRDTKSQPMGSYSINNTTSYPYGDGQKLGGGKIRVRGHIRTTVNYEGGADELIKWNSDSFELTPEDDRMYKVIQDTIFYYGTTGRTTDNVKFYYGIPKKADSNTFENIVKSQRDDFTFYESYEEASAKGKISAIYVESNNYMTAGTQLSINLPLTVLTHKFGSLNEKGTPNIVFTTGYYYTDSERENEFVWQLPVNTYTIYDEDNNIKTIQSPVGSPTPFDTLGIVGLQVRNEITTDKTTYYSTERVKTTVSGTATIPESMDADEDVKIKVILPKGLNVIPDTIQYDGKPVEAIINTLPDGTTEIEYTTQVNVGKNVKDLTFESMFDSFNLDFVNNTTSLNISTIISTDKDKSVDAIRTKDTTITVTKVGQLGISQTINKYVEDINKDFEVKINPYTTTELEDSVKGVVNLPVNGDANGSKFNGTIKISSIKKIGTKGMKVYINKTLNTVKNPNSIDFTTGGWEEYTTQNLAEYKAVAYEFSEGITNQDKNIGLTINYTATNNKPKDVYKSVVYGNSASNYKVETISNVVTHTIVARSIEGTVWKDANEDGIMEDSESKFADISVALFKKGLLGYEKVETDLSGETISVKTDATGKYKIQNVDSGEYAVGFKQSDFKDWNITKYLQGSSENVNSKVNTEVKDGYVLTDAKVLPEVADMTVSIYEQKYMNLGLYLTPKGKITKSIVGVTDEVPTYKVGDKFTYELTYSNTVAESTILNAKVEDVLNSSLKLVEDSVKVDGKVVPYTLSSNVLTVELGNISDTTERKITFEVEVLNTATGEIPNEAKLTGSNISPEDSNVVVINVPPIPYLTKEANKDSVQIGDEVTYAIMVENEEGGGVWKDVVIKDFLTDPNLSIVPNSFELLKVDGTIVQLTNSDMTISGTTISVPVGDIKSGEVVQLSFKVTITAYAENYNNTAVANGEVIDSNSDVKNIISKLSPTNISITKDVLKDGVSIDAKEVDTNSVLTYKLVVTNTTENAPIRNIVVTDDLPDSVTYKAGTTKVNGESIADSVVDGKLMLENLSLGMGESLTITFDVDVLRTSADIFENVASTEGIDGATNGKLEADSNKVSNTVNPQPSILKEASVSKVNVSDEFMYTITLNNGKNKGAWRDVVLEDVLDSKLQLVPNTTKLITTTEESLNDADVWKDGKLTVNVGNILESDIVKITFKVKVKTFSESYLNTATSYGSNGTPPPSSVVVKNDKTPTDVKIVKGVYQNGEDVDGKTLATNSNIVYKLVVNNTKGNSESKNVVVKDKLPDYFEADLAKATVNGELFPIAMTDNNTIIAQLPNLVNDTKTVIEIPGKINREMTPTFTNKGEVSAVDVATNEDIGAESNVVSNNVKPDPSIVKEVNNAKVNLGETLTWKINFTNKENMGGLLNPILVDEVIPELEVVPNTTMVDGVLQEDAEVWENNKLTISFNTLFEGDSHEVVYETKVVSVSEDGKLTNTATLLGDDSENIIEVSDDAESKASYVESIITSVKTVANDDGEDIDGKTVEVGSNLNYTITLENTIENSKVADLKVVDNLPYGYTKDDISEVLLDGKKVDVEFNEEGTSFIYTLGTIEGAFKHKLTYTLVANNGDDNGLIKNTQQTTGKVYTDSEPKDITLENSVNNFIESIVEVNKDVDKKLVKANEEFNYVLTVKTGNGKTLKDATITDSLPEGLTLVKDSIKVYNKDRKQIEDVEDLTKDGLLKVIVPKIEPNSMVVVEFKVKTSDKNIGEKFENIFELTIPGKNGKQIVSNKVVTIKNPIKYLVKTGASLMGYIVSIIALLIAIALYIYYKKRK